MKTNTKIKIAILFFFPLLVTSCSREAEKHRQTSSTVAAVKKDSVACCASGIPARFSAKSQFVKAAGTKK